MGSIIIVAAVTHRKGSAIATAARTEEGRHKGLGDSHHRHSGAHKGPEGKAAAVFVGEGRILSRCHSSWQHCNLIQPGGRWRLLPARNPSILLNSVS